MTVLPWYRRKIKLKCAYTALSKCCSGHFTRTTALRFRPKLDPDYQQYPLTQITNAPT